MIGCGWLDGGCEEPICAADAVVSLFVGILDSGFGIWNSGFELRWQAAVPAAGLPTWPTVDARIGRIAIFRNTRKWG
jgi:hypothetical protein